MTAVGLNNIFVDFKEDKKKKPNLGVIPPLYYHLAMI